MKIAVVLYASNYSNPGVLLLKRSLAEWGWPDPIMVGEESVWSGHHRKLENLRDCLPILKSGGYTHVCYPDSFDSLCVGKVEEAYQQCDDGMLVSAESNCYPHAEKASLYPKVESRFRYCNGGGILGNIDFLGDVYLKGGKFGCDQTYLTDMYLAPTPGIRLDTQCEFWQTVAFEKPYGQFFEIEGAKVYNKLTGTYPTFIHANSRNSLRPFPGGEDWVPWWEGES